MPADRIELLRLPGHFAAKRFVFNLRRVYRWSFDKAGAWQREARLANPMLTIYFEAGHAMLPKLRSTPSGKHGRC